MSSSANTSTIKWPMTNLELKEWFSRDNIPLQELIQIWLQMDKNASTRKQIEELSHDLSTEQKLRDLLASRIQFGTAGPQSHIYLSNCKASVDEWKLGSQE
jgi:hypothetical protein